MERSFVAAWCLVCVVAVAGAPAVAAAGDVPAVTINGIWKLERQEDVQSYLQAIGANWFMRRMASLAGSNSVERIDCGPERCQIQSSTPVTDRTHLYVTDGATKTEGTAGVNESVEFLSRLEDGALVVEVDGPRGHRQTRRERVGEKLLLTIHHLDSGAEMKLWFTRESPDGSAP